MAGIWSFGYFLLKKTPYCVVDEEAITVRNPFKRSLKFNEIKEVRRSSDSYIFKADGKELIVNTQIIGSDHMPQFKKAVQGFDLLKA